MFGLFKKAQPTGGDLSFEMTPKQLVLQRVERQRFPLVSKVLYHDQLRELYDSGEIVDEELESALETAVNAQGRREHDLVASGRQYADHLGSNEPILVYAVDSGAISPEEAASMPIDHGQSLADYCNEHRKPELLSELRETLLNPKPLFDGYDMSDDCSGHCLDH